MTITPLYDRILVKRKDPREKTESGLFLPSTAQEKSHLAEVVAVGKGRIGDDGTLSKLAVEPGMTVYLSKWAGDEIVVDGEKHLFVKEQDLLGVMM